MEVGGGEMKLGIALEEASGASLDRDQAWSPGWGPGWGPGWRGAGGSGRRFWRWNGRCALPDSIESIAGCFILPQPMDKTSKSLAGLDLLGG